MNTPLLRNSLSAADVAFRAIFDALADAPGAPVTRADIDAMLSENGLLVSDPRLAALRDVLSQVSGADADRWGNRPADDAARSGSTDIVAVLDAASSKSGPPSHKLSEQEGSSL